jgi:formiminotetrahydrofolate cyclodeaminase
MKILREVTVNQNLLKMEKEDFKRKAKESIDEIFARIDELDAKKDVAFGKAKAEYEEMIVELKTKKDELQAKFKKLMDGSDDEWEEVQNAFSSAKDSMKEGFSKMVSIFKKVADGTPEDTSSPQTGQPADDLNKPKES